MLPMLQQGSSNAEIALSLQLSVETIRTHARNIYRKLGIASRRELSALPLRVPPDQVDDAPDACVGGVHRCAKGSGTPDQCAARRSYEATPGRGPGLSSIWLAPAGLDRSYICLCRSRSLSMATVKST